MRFIALTFIFIMSCAYYSAQNKIYNPDADAKADIQKTLDLAKEENKFVILQVGGNWCKWCLLFDKYRNEEVEVAKTINDNYLYYHLNYSKENKNQDILDEYGNPEKNGFPVLVVLDAYGKVLHTQETGSLEEGKGYNKEKVLEFLNYWTPVAHKSRNWTE